mmetsp:Transcript_14890/g.40127  ORF Transcript_14890/g.40127 Transcript_14890/m.40127 type:complete len:90 (+) Transcript_14890:1211-1480(+)
MRHTALAQQPNAFCRTFKAEEVASWQPLALAGASNAQILCTSLMWKVLEELRHVTDTWICLCVMIMALGRCRSTLHLPCLNQDQQQQHM